MCKCLSVFFVSNKKRDDDDVSRTCFVFRFNFTWFLVLKTKRIHCLFTSLILYACRLFLMTISLGHHPEIMTSTMMMMMIVLGLCLLRKLLLQVSLFPFPFCPFNSRRGSCSASMINGYFLLVSSLCFFSLFLPSSEQSWRWLYPWDTLISGLENMKCHFPFLLPQQFSCKTRNAWCLFPNNNRVKCS